MEIDIAVCWCGNKNHSDYYVCHDRSIPVKIIRCKKCGTQTAGRSLSEMVGKWNQLISDIIERTDNMQQKKDAINYHESDAYNLSKVNLSNRKVSKVLGL